MGELKWEWRGEFDKTREMKLGVMLVNNNEQARVARLLDQLVGVAGKIELEVFLLDNGCQARETTKGILVRYKLPISYEASDEALKFAAAYNGLFAKAKLAGCDWVWLLEKVVSVRVESWKFLERMGKEGFGVVGGGVAGLNRHRAEWWAGQFMVARTGEGPSWQTDRVGKSGMLVKLSVYGKLKFDGGYYQEMEEWDFCERARALGAKVGRVGSYSVRIKQTGGDGFQDAYFWGRNPGLLAYKRARDRDAVLARVPKTVWVWWWLLVFWVGKKDVNLLASFGSGGGDGVKLMWERFRSPSSTSLWKSR